jgi:hypothetical protein
MSLKTKGFSRETEALKWIGGGENRTLVLGKVPIDDYMLIALKSDDLGVRRPAYEINVLLSILNAPPRSKEKVHTRVNDDSSNAPGQALGYRAAKAVKP